MTKEDYTTAELLEEGEEIDAGDQTEEPLTLTVQHVEVQGLHVRIWVKELAFPLTAQVGEQVTYAEA
ncbi:hypothetical protein [Streptomyces sp. NPDC047525]|uniref:hypothetical protein n=1 Tax=Streptomyces sp. NPDC047525 TaxID=3155264 RepID=UPI0033E989C5